MDGRNLRHLPWGLLLLACGCTRPLVLRTEKADADAVVHKAPTYEAYANYRAVAGFAPEHSPQQQAQFREEAKLAYQKAIEVDPKHLPAYVGLARLQVRCEDYAGAGATYGRTLKLTPRDAALWHECGLCQCRQKNWQEAVVSMRKACELSPGDRRFLMTLGYTLGRAGMLRESLTTLAQAEGEAKAHYDLARLLRHMNHVELAKQQVTLAVGKDPNLPGARQLLAEMEGKGESAIQAASHKESASESEAPNVMNTARTTPAPSPATTSPQSESPSAAVTANQVGAREGKPVRIPPPPIIPVNR